MSIVVSAAPRLQTVSVTDDLISVCLTDGRTITVPLAWSWRLSDATAAQRRHFEIIGNGTRITGLMSMRTSVSKACCTASLPDARAN